MLQASQAVPSGPASDGHRRPFLRRVGASEYLRDTWGIQRAPATLAKLAVVGRGPKFRKAGRWPMYTPADLDAWARELLGEGVAA
jgi:hypothetical protein